MLFPALGSPSPEQFELIYQSFLRPQVYRAYQRGHWVREEGPLQEKGAAFCDSTLMLYAASSFGPQRFSRADEKFGIHAANWQTGVVSPKV